MPFLLDEHPIVLYLFLQLEYFNVDGLQFRIELFVLDYLPINLPRDLLFSTNRLFHRTDQLQKPLHGVHVKTVKLETQTMKRPIKATEVPA